MTKNINELEVEFEGDNSSNSNGSSLTDDFSIRDTVIEEEERLIIENEKIATEEEVQFLLLEEQQTEEDLVKKREAEIKEKRYKRLMHLLRNSKMYAAILQSRIQENELSVRKREVINGSQSSEQSSLRKQKSLTEYNIGEVLTKEQIKENMGENEKISNCENSEPDFFQKTKVTDLGFTVSYKQPDLLEGGAMRDYQLKGLEWMINLYMNGVNGILADEMGLGKTIQVISFICYLIQVDIKGPFLIVAPLSTVTNWMAEFKRFAPKVPTMLYHGTEAERKALLPKIFQTSKVGSKSAQKVVITSFQIPLRDKAVLGKINWYYLIIDEGHRIKNHNSLLSRTLRQFNTIGRLLLTGTPLQNDLSELWSLLNFLLPEVFSSLDVFESWFDIKELEKNGARFMMDEFNVDVVNILQEILVPFLLRREKKDVNLQLPPKKEVLIYCPMTQHQKELYQATLDHSIEFLLKPKEDVFNIKEPLPKRRCFLNSPYGKKTKSDTPRRKKAESPVKDSERFSTNVVLKNPQMQLRKIVNHPYLIQYPLKPGTEELRIDEDIVKESGKLLVLDAMLSKLKNRGHKVVIFSYFKLVLDILEDYAIMRDYQYCRLDGDSRIADRDEEILKFVSDPNIFIFFVSIRAGGLGINLTAADTVIFYDSDWMVWEKNDTALFEDILKLARLGQSPAKIKRQHAEYTTDGCTTVPHPPAYNPLHPVPKSRDVYKYCRSFLLNNPQVNLQSQDRCHRIGQTKPVMVYRLCGIGTVDERIIERGNAKRRLEKMILQKGKFTLNSKNSKNLNVLDLQELKKLLESTDHDAVINSNGFVLTDEELEALLDRSNMSNDSLPPEDDNEKKVFKVLNYEN